MFLDGTFRFGVTMTDAAVRLKQDIGRAYVLLPAEELSKSEMLVLLTEAQLADAQCADYSIEDLMAMGLHLIDPDIPPPQEGPGSFICSCFVAWLLKRSVPRLFAGDPNAATPASVAAPMAGYLPAQKIDDCGWSIVVCGPAPVGSSNRQSSIANRQSNSRRSLIVTNILQFIRSAVAWVDGKKTYFVCAANRGGMYQHYVLPAAGDRHADDGPAHRSGAADRHGAKHCKKIEK